MANDKRFVAKNGLQTANILFTYNNSSIQAGIIDGNVLSFSGNAGQLFSVSDSLTGTIFGVNDISGVPSIEVDDIGTVRLAQFGGNVLIGSNVNTLGAKFLVDGNVSLSKGILLANTRGANGQVITSDGTNATWANVTTTSAIIYVMDGGESTITTGVKGELHIPFTCTINSWALLGDATGSAQVDIWKTTLANYPPTVANTITGSSKPRIVSANSNSSATLTGWTATINSGDTLRFNVDSVTTLKRATIVLKITK